jgi:hypothetical protein
VQLTGDDIAKSLSEVLRQNLNAYKFGQRRFAAIDLDASGQIDAEEIFPYLLELGYSNDEAQQILAFSPEAPHHSGTPLGVGMDRRVAVGTEATNQSGES